MKIMVAFLGKKRNKGNEYIKGIKEIHRENIENIHNGKSRKNAIKNNFINKKNNILDNVNFFNRDEKVYRDNKFSIINKKLDYNYFFSYIKCTMLFFLVFIIFSSFSGVKEKIINAAIYLRQAEKSNIEIASFAFPFSLFDKNNYLFEKIEVSSNDKNENPQVEEDKNYENDKYEIIDNEVEKYNLEEVFNNQEVSSNILSETATLQKLNVNNIYILNYSSNRNIDFKSILQEDVVLTKKSDKILLYNTHTSESYTNSPNYQFEYSSVMRSLDARYNMLAIAKELNENLLKKGFSSTQDTTPHDYGAYTGAYLKSRQTIQKDLSSMGGAGIIMDVHRDAVEDLTFRPIASINGVEVSQLMLVVGIGDNEYWKDNLKIALKIQSIANKVYPGLFRQMIIRDSTYNQDLNKYSMLVEFGATGNTIDEVKLSTRCLANLLNILYKD